MFFRRVLVTLTLVLFAFAACAAHARDAAAAPLITTPFLSFDTDSVPSALASADLNGDGYLDLAVVNASSGSVSVLLGNGNGTFGAKSDLRVGQGPCAVAIRDLNGDGKLDLVVVNAYSNSVSVLLGNGNGTFGASTDFATGIDPSALAIGDLNGDGHPDLAVTNYADTTVSVLLGNGNGTFAARTNFKTGANPSAVAIGAVFADGSVDLAVANQINNAAAGSVSVLRGNGDGTFATKVDFATGPRPTFLAIADLNHDGFTDLVVANGSNYAGTPGRSVSVLLGTGRTDAFDLAFGSKVDYATGVGPYSVAVADLNGDGKLDLAVANAGAFPAYGNTVSVLLGTGTGSFAAKVDYGTGNGSCSVVAGDLNADGKLDLAVANYFSNTISVLLGNGNGTFGAKTEIATGAGANFVTTTDLNGDGKVDMLVANYSAGTVSVFLGNGNGTFRPKTDYATTGEPIFVALADLNMDNRLDLVAVNYSGGYGKSLSLFMGNGNGTFGIRNDVACRVGPTCVSIGDLNGDAIPDLVVASAGAYPNYDDTLSVFLGNGNGTFTPDTTYATTGLYPIAMAMHDLNGDGKLDLVVANYASDSVSVMLGNGDGSFAPRHDYQVGNEPYALAMADLNGDGKLDLAVVNGGDYMYSPGSTVSILLGNGDGTFGAKTDYSTGTEPTSVAIADLNADGFPDLAVTNYTGNSVSLLLGAGNGTFGSRADYGTAAEPVSVAIADLNADGKPDLLVAGYASNSVFEMQNLSSTGLLAVNAPSVSAGAAHVRAWPNPIVGNSAIAYSLPGRADVSLCVYDVAGRLVSTLAKGVMAAGVHETRWNLSTDDGSKVAPGIYMVQLRAGARHASTRVAVLR